jgi:hypothetical protein
VTFDAAAIPDLIDPTDHGRKEVRNKSLQGETFGIAAGGCFQEGMIFARKKWDELGRFLHRP